MWFGTLGAGSSIPQVTNKTVVGELLSLPNEMKNEGPFEQTSTYRQTCKYLRPRRAGGEHSSVTLEEISAAEAGWVEVPTRSHSEYPAPGGGGGGW